MDIIRDLIKQVNKLQLQIDQLIKPEVADGKIVTSAGALTAGRVPYVDANQRLADSANLVWDNTNGYMGIGTTSPQGLLHVQATGATATLFVENITAGNANLVFRGDGANKAITGWERANNIYRIAVGSVPYAFTIKQTGEVGMGTNAPASRLDIGAGAITMAEMTAPSAPAANKAIIYTEDNGSGKTRLMVKFASGSAQQIAIEP